MYFYEDSGLKLLAMIDKEFKTGYALNFLEEVKTELLGRYSLEQIRTAPAGGLADFKPVLEAKMSQFNANYNDPLLVAKAKLGSLEHLTVENFNRLVERDNDINSIKNQVEVLTENSTLIKGNAVRLRRTTERQYWMSYILMIIVIAVSSSGHYRPRLLDH